jgi:hypothetical protein
MRKNQFRTVLLGELNAAVESTIGLSTRTDGYQDPFHQNSQQFERTPLSVPDQFVPNT